MSIDGKFEKIYKESFIYRVVSTEVSTQIRIQDTHSYKYIWLATAAKHAILLSKEYVLKIILR